MVEEVAQVHIPAEEIALLALQGVKAFPEERHAELHAHLDRCEECAGALAEVRRSVDSGVGQAFSSRRLLAQGVLVAGRYRIVRYIASGGMGEVYEAEDTSMAHTPVALKTVSASAADEPSAIRRLEREARTAMLVSHPHACRVYHFDVHRLPRDQGLIHFITMELILGETLRERLQRSGPLSDAEVLDLSKQLLGALGAAHARKVLHRDLKSSNVMLRRGSSTSIDGVVMDFGLAKGLDAGEEAHITNSRAFVGSATHASPEQLLGRDLTEASDLYAFGVVLFEALTGTLPFDAKGTLQMALQRLEMPAPKVSSLRPGVSPHWDRIVGRCLERDLSRRFRSTAEVEQALAPLHLTRDERKSRQRLAAAFGAACLTVGGGLWFWGSAEPAGDAGAVEPLGSGRRGFRAVPGAQAGSGLDEAPQTGRVDEQVYALREAGESGLGRRGDEPAEVVQVLEREYVRSGDPDLLIRQARLLRDFWAASAQQEDCERARAAWTRCAELEGLGAAQRKEVIHSLQALESCFTQALPQAPVDPPRTRARERGAGLPETGGLARPLGRAQFPASGDEQGPEGTRSHPSEVRDPGTRRRVPPHSEGGAVPRKPASPERPREPSVLRPTDRFLAPKD